MEVYRLSRDLRSTSFANVPIELIDNFDQLAKMCDEIDSFASEHDFNNVKFNGFRSMVKILDKFAMRCRDPLSNSKQSFNSTLEMSRLMIDITTKIIACHEKLTSHSQPENKMESYLYRLNEFKQSRPVLQERIKYYWAYFSLFWMNPECRPMALMYTKLLSMLGQFPASLVSIAYPEYQGAILAKLGWTANAFFPTNIANCSNNILYSSLSMARAFMSRITVRKITVPRQNEWILPENGDQVIHNLSFSRSSQKPVQCRLIRYNGAQPNGSVVFYAQGGAFIIDARQFHEKYFFDWVSKLEGAVILNVEYSRAVRYPIALQEFLDVYLWLTSGSQEVTDQLGFEVKNIVFCGDSAGGHLVFSTALAARDIQIASPSSIQIFPSAFVGFYPSLSLIHGSLPSMYLSTLEAFVTPPLLFNIISLYVAGVVYESECYELDHDLTVRRSDPYGEMSSYKNFYNTWIRRERSWMECEPDKARARFAKICAKALKPYMAPTECYNLELIKDLPLFLISCEFDPLLDSTIQFAKSWKGKVTVDVLEDLHHAFLLYTNGETAQMGSETCLRRLQESLGIQSA